MRTIRTHHVPIGAAALAVGLGAAMAAPAAAATAAPRRADIRVAVSVDPTEASVLSGWTYLTVDVQNVGTATARDISLTISRPSGTGYAAGGENPSPPGWNCTFGNPEWTCTRRALEAGAAAPLALRLLLPAGQAGSSAEVGARATTTSNESNIDNNSGVALVRYVAPDLEVSMAAKPVEVIVGGEVTYWIDVRNLGANAAYVDVELPVPPGMRGVSYNGPMGWSCGLGTDVTTGIQSYGCQHGAVAAGGTAEPLTLTMKVEQAEPGEALTTTATVATEPGVEQVTTNNSASVSVNVVQAGHLSGIMWSDYDRDGVRESLESGSDMLAEWVRIFPQAPAEGDPSEIGARPQYDGTYRVALKPGRYVVEVGVDKYYQYDFSPPNVGDDATDSDVIPIEDSNPYYRIAQSVVVDVPPGGETVVDAGVVSP